MEQCSLFVLVSSPPLKKNIINIMSDNISVSEANNQMEEIMLFGCIAAQLFDGYFPYGNCWEHSRLDWDEHVDQLIHEGKFVNEYMMSSSAHAHLLEILGPQLCRCSYNSRCCKPLSLEHIVAIGLRGLVGGHIKDQ